VRTRAGDENVINIDEEKGSLLRGAMNEEGKVRAAAEEAKF
jgi:hypothetical protein